MVTVSRSWRPTTHTWALKSILADLVFWFTDLRATYTYTGRRRGRGHGVRGHQANHHGSLYGVTWVLGVSTAGLVAEAVASRSIVWAHQYASPLAIGGGS